MYIVAIVLLTFNLLLMLFFYFKIRRTFSAERYEALMQDRMNTILRDFNFQTNQAITVLEERIDEMKELIADADKRFVALSKKINASSQQNVMLQQELINQEGKKENPSIFLSEREEKIAATSSNPPPQPTMITMQQEVSCLPPQVSLYEDLGILQQDTSQNDAILKMRVVEMYKNGWSIDFIADKLKLPLEEVRIITFMSKTQE